MEKSDFSWEDVVVVERHDVLESNDENILPQDQDIIARIRTWLQPTDYHGDGSEYQKHLLSHLPGTGDWFLKSHVYQQWHNSDEHGMLWVRGIPGSGKSVLTASVIHGLLEEQVPVLYFFFRQIVDANYNPRAALQDWLAQVLIYSPPLQLQLRNYLEEKKSLGTSQGSCRQRELSSLSTADLWQHLRTALSHLPKAYILVDALDEMDCKEDTDSFIQNLSDLAHWRPSQVMTLVTCRPAVNVERVLARENSLRLILDEGLIDADIGAYVRSRLNTSSILPELHQSIQAAIPGRAQGLFLYAKLAMDTLLEEGVDAQVALHRLPENLHHMYSQLLHEHARRTRVSIEDQLLIMQWITHSSRPLRLIEMSDMLSNEPSFGKKDLGAAKSYVRSACGPLLELLPDETLCVLHHSLTEFLKGTTREDSKDYPILEPGTTHNRLALICLSYLQNGSLEGAEPEQPACRRPFHKKISNEPLLAPFTRYAALNWHIHAKRSSEHGTDSTELNNMLDKFTAHVHFQNWAHLAKLRSDASRTITPLSMAVVLGLSDYLRAILSQQGTDCDEGAPIVWAADKGFADVIGLLIKNGANVDQYDSEGYTALHRAAMNDRSEVVRLLLESGCKVESLTRIRAIDSGFRRPQHSALWYACNHGHNEIVAQFLPHIKTMKGVNKALSFAVEEKRAIIVQQLLKHPLANLAVSTGEPLLKLACSKRDLDTVRLLLAAGADVNQYALHALSRSKEATDQESLMTCFRLLLESGADIHQVEKQSNGTPLHQAADAVTVQILLEAGANIEAENGSGETPLFTCNEVAVLHSLVKIGNADLEKTNTCGQTPLLAGLTRPPISYKQKDLYAILALIDLGANVNAVDKSGNGVFHLAIKQRFRGSLDELIPRLCAAGADINKSNDRGEAPIHLTKIEVKRPGHTGIFGFEKKPSQFEILVSAGASLTPTATDVMKTPVFAWISNSICESQDHELPGVLETLQKCKESLNVTDDRGRTLLHDAVRGTGRKAQIKFLIDQGLEPNAADHEGNTLWHEAAESLASSFYDLADGSPEPFDQLIQLGTDPTQSNHHGRTPLHVLSSMWPESVYQFTRSTGCGVGSGHLNKTTAFDVVSALHPNVDVPDKDGVTPLHLASTFSEYLTRRLLEKNANPSCMTKEGCNAVHLSARSRMPNIVGMLLENLRSRSGTSLESAINAEDNLGRVPLYYACSAGLYETAKYLVDAGATVESTDYDSSPWKGIAEHELEKKNWINRGRDKHAGAVLVADTRRSSGHNNLYQSDRIDELITLLLAKDTSASEFLNRAIADAASQEADYTVECLLRARNSMPLDGKLVSNVYITESINRRQTKRKDMGKICRRCKVKHIDSALKRAVFLQNYHILPEMLLAEDELQPHAIKQKEKVLAIHELVDRGFTSALRYLVSSGGLQMPNDLLWDGEQDNSHSESFGSMYQKSSEPLLLRACRRDVSNIDVIRILIEQVGLDVNTQRHIQEPTGRLEQTFHDVGRPVQGESILHILVRGEHWWYLGEGIRYVLEQKPNTEMQDMYGMTPLSAALNKCGWLIFNKHAVELLVQHGADVNAVDLAGNSCLAKACSDKEMTALLLDHGAVVTQDVFMQAIALNNADLLTLLLSRGANPNVCGKLRQPRQGGSTKIYHEEHYPLHRLLSKSKYRLKTASDHENHKRMIETLLDHGANPCAPYDGSTILHELIQDNEDISVLFMKPGIDLDLECRNVSGLTPLLMACLQTSSPDKTRSHNAENRSTIGMLIHHGVDIRARDCKGNNFLHLFTKNGGNRSDLLSIIQQAPRLINQPNNEGSTPLHIAMKSLFREERINLFLDNDGDIHTTDGKGDSMLHILMRCQWGVTGRCGEVTGTGLTLFNRLLAKGANINARNEAGETPIFSFMRDGRVSSNSKHVKFSDFLEHPVYELFTRCGVDWQVLNAEGQNLLHAVAAGPSVDHLFFDRISPDSNKRDRFAALLNFGLDAGLEDKAGRTPLDIAVEVGQKEILELFQKN